MDGPVICPECLGTGRVVVAGGDPTGWYARDHACLLCGGLGMISAEQDRWRTVGMEIRQVRVERSITLHDAAERLGMSVTEVSAMETGRANPLGLLAAWTEKGIEA